jgi:hypothetical protein
MSETPRTDAICDICNIRDNDASYTLLADFARLLERENSSLREKHRTTEDVAHTGTRYKSWPIGTLDRAQDSVISLTSENCYLRKQLAINHERAEEIIRAREDRLAEQLAEIDELLNLLKKADDALDDYGLGAAGSPLRCAIRCKLKSHGNLT